MKYIFTSLLAIFILMACTKNEPVFENKNLLKNTKWLVTNMSKNGINDTSVVNEKIILDFRSDGKMYTNQIMPFYLDTVKYDFIDNNNIRISKPWASYPVDINYSIVFLNSVNFNFTLTSAQHSDVYNHKTIRQ